MRCFIALDLPDDLKQAILHTQNLIREKNFEENFFRGKYIEPGNVHLTLKFLGEITSDTILCIKEALRTIRLFPFTAALLGAGVFSPECIRIVWLKLDGVDALQQAVDDCVSHWFRKEERFMGHITLARVKQVHEKDKLLSFLRQLRIDNKVQVAEIKSFSLYASTRTPAGPMYECLERFNLT